MESECGLCEISAVGPTAACDTIGRCEMVVHQEPHCIGDVLYRGESPFPVVGMHERAAEPPGATDIREEDRDAGLEQRRKEFVVARAALTFGPAVQEDHGADRLDARR